MSLIDVQNLTFAYDGSYENIFENVSFQIDIDWRLGFVGRNGRGKTTFLRLLLGQYPYQGKISASVDFAYFPYPVEEPERTVAEVAERLSPGGETWELERELAGLELDGAVLDRSYESLSHGERTKVLLAILFLGEDRFLLIDEPTNHLDLHGREVLSRYLRGKQGYLLVSHDRAFLDGCVDHILAINRADITLQKGNFSTWWENKQRQDAFELAQDQRLRKDIRRLESTARQSRAWADRVESEKIGAIEHRERYNECGGRAYIGEQSRRMQQRRKNLERRQQRAIEEKSALLKNREREETLKLTQLPYHKKRLLEVRDLTDGGLRKRPGLPGPQLFPGEWGAPCHPGPQRLREVQHSEAPLRGGDPPYRPGGPRLPAHGLLCEPGYLRPLRQPLGPGGARRDRPEPLPHHPPEAGFLPEPV